MPLPAWAAKYGSNADFRSKADRKIAGMIPGIKAAIRVYDWASPDGGASAPPAGGASQAGSCNFNMGGEITNTRDMVRNMAWQGVDPGDWGGPGEAGAGLPQIYNQVWANRGKLVNIEDFLSDWSYEFAVNFGHFTMDAAGKAAFDQAVIDGDIDGEGLIVGWKRNVPLGQYYPVLNPYFFTGASPSGDYVFNLFEVVLDILNNASIRPGYLP